MRYIDLAVAALVGTSALAGIVAWDPGTADSGARGLKLQAVLRDDLTAYVQGRGVAWFARSPPSVICSALAGASNSTFGMQATLGSLSCGSPPPPGSLTATLSMTLLPFEVKVEAWSSAPG